MKINRNISELKPSATLLINEKVKELREKGKKITHFGFGQSPFPIHNSIVDELKNHANNNHYLPVNGLNELRHQVSNFLSIHQGIQSASEFIFIGPGSKELLYQSVLIFEGHFIIPKGSWVSYIPQIKSKGGTYSILETTLEDNFKLTASRLEMYLSDSQQQQHVLILNSPNNPTGAIYSNDEYENLAKVCRKYNVIVFSDEIYSQINFNDDFSPSISKFYPEGTLVFGGLSKVFSAGGYRLGFMSLPKELKDLSVVYSSLFSETFSCVSSPVQFSAIKAYQYSKELQQYVATSAAILDGISSYIYHELTKCSIQCTTPQGSFYMMIGFNNFKENLKSLKIDSSTKLSHHLLDNYGIALLPGTDFGFKSNELFFRMAFVDFDGEKVMKAYYTEKNINENFIKEHCKRIYNGVQQLIAFTKLYS
ncbi:MAG: pyridoxal phosphate-dependent aminotransferase [Flavobacteriaceae bacterium]